MNIRKAGLIKLLVVGLVIMVAGILMMAHTESFLMILMISAGVWAFINGLSTLSGVRKWSLTGTTKTLALIKGICNIFIGVCAVIITIASPGSALTVVVYVFATELVFSAIVSFQNAVVSGTFGISELRLHFIIEGIVTFLIAMMMFFRPVETLVSVIRVIAIICMTGGVVVMAVAIVGFIRKPAAEVTVEIGEAEIVDDKDTKKKK